MDFPKTHAGAEISTYGAFGTQLSGAEKPGPSRCFLEKPGVVRRAGKLEVCEDSEVKLGLGRNLELGCGEEEIGLAGKRTLPARRVPTLWGHSL